MIEKISTLDIRERLGDILNRVALRHDAFIIERKGKPLAAMVPVEKLQQVERLARTRLMAALSGRPTLLTDVQAERLADKAKHRSRRRKSR
jgi:prevent-host-death family protein